MKLVTVFPYVGLEQRGSHWTDFNVIWYESVVRKSIKKFRVSLRSDKNDGYFTWRPVNIFDHTSLIFFMAAPCVLIVTQFIHQQMHIY